MFPTESARSLLRVSDLAVLGDVVGDLEISVRARALRVDDALS